MHRIQSFRRDRLFGFHQMCGGMSGGGTIHLGGGYTCMAVISIRQVNKVIFNIGFVTFARSKVAGGGVHEKITCPQGAQIHIDAALHIHKQGALAFFLQYRE